MNKTIFLSMIILAAASVCGAVNVRKYPENELLARPAVVVTVGREKADIVGADNRALQAAVDYVGNLGGGIVEVGPGEYLMRDALHMRSRVILRGAGESTVLRKDASVRCKLAADGDFGEEAITVENAAGFDIGRGVYVTSKRAGGFYSITATILNKKDNYLTLSVPLNADCTMAEEAYAETIFPVISACDVCDFQITDLVVDGNRDHNGLINGCRGAGIYFCRGDGGVIENCVVRAYNGDGISFQQSNDVKVFKSLVERNAGKGLHPGSGSQRPIIRNCRSFSNDDDGFFFCWRVRNAVVEDNEFRGNAGFGVSIGHKDSDNVVRRNVIADNARGGVYWRNEKNPQAAHRITLDGNTIENNHGPGLYIDGETCGTVITNNIIRDTGKGSADAVQKIGVRVGAAVGEINLTDNKIEAKEPVVRDRK